MGNTSSLPERVYRAVKTGNVGDVQQVCQQLQRSTLDLAGRRRLLQWTDAEGRTPLSLAAQRNYLQIAKMLLDAGADLHYVARQRPSGGSALHEAVHNKHEQMVELLLSYRADPWLENCAGHTALDLACANGHTALVRRLEKCALFSGTVAMKVQQLGGFSSALKDRWCVILPRYQLPLPGQNVSTVRVMLWVFKDTSFAEPRTKVWLDGASAFRIGGEGLDGIVHLHPNHEQPKNAYSKYNKGWLLFFKPSSPNPSAAIARAAFQSFIATCNKPFDAINQAPAATPPSASFSGATSSPAAPRPLLYGRTNSSSNIGTHLAPAAAAAGAGPAGAAGAAGHRPYHQQEGPYPPPMQQPSHAAHNTLQVRPATAPPPGMDNSALLASQVAGDAWDPMVAAPGETDEDFARRLSGYMGSTSAHGSPHRAGAGQPGRHSANSSISSMSGGGISSGPGSFSVGPQEAAAGHLATAPLAPQFSDNPFAGSQPLASTSAQQASTSAGAAGVVGLPGTHISNQTGVASSSMYPAVPSSAVPVAAPLAAALQRLPATEAAMSPSALDDGRADAEACVICLCSGREVGFLHGDSVHRCVCRECAKLVQAGNPCPMCRAPIERIMAVY